MTNDALQSYLNLITGVRQATRERAAAAAQGLLAQAGLDEVAADAQNRLHRLTEEIVIAGRANRDMLQNVIRVEVEKALGRVGFARTEDVDRLRTEFDELQARIDDLEAEARSAGRPGAPAGFAAEAEPPPVAAAAPAKKAAAKKSPVKKAPAKKAAKAPSQKAPAQKSPAQKSPAQKAPAKQAARPPAKQAASTKSAPKGSAPTRSGSKKTATKRTTAKKAANAG